jgi:excisionase family DNA binding protein
MPMDAIDDDLVRADWVAGRLGLPKRTVYAHLRNGLLPGRRLGNRWLILRVEIEKIRAEAAKPSAPAEASAI